MVAHARVLAMFENIYERPSAEEPEGFDRMYRLSSVPWPLTPAYVKELWTAIEKAPTLHHAGCVVFANELHRGRGRRRGRGRGRGHERGHERGRGRGYARGHAQPFGRTWHQPTLFDAVHVQKQREPKKQDGQLIPWPQAPAPSPSHQPHHAP